MSHALVVHADRDTIWRHLLDKAEHPERYVPGVTSAKVLERFEGGLVRRMQVGDAPALVERITWDEPEGVVLFELVDHPVYTGYVENRILERGEGGRAFEVSMHWDPHAPEPPDAPDWASAVRGAVLATKAHAEGGGSPPRG